MTAMQKQFLANQQQLLNSPPATSGSSTTSNQFFIAPDILRQLSTNPSKDWLHSIQRQSNPNLASSGVLMSDMEQPQVIPVSTTLLRHLFQLAASARQT